MDQTVDNLRARLMIEEERLIARGVVEVTEVLLTRTTSKAFNKSGNKALGKKGKCFKCGTGKAGHWKSECGKKYGNSSSSATHGEAFVSMVDQTSGDD